MRYKVLQKRNPITKNSNSIHLLHEAYPIQVLLRTKIMNLFTSMNLATHQENRICGGWAPKGSHGYIEDEVKNISFSVI